MSDYSFIENAAPEYIDRLYQQYLQDKLSVEPGWRTFFAGFELAGKPGNVSTETPLADEMETNAFLLVQGFRKRGHLLSTTNPLKKRKDRHPFLELDDFNLNEQVLDKPFLAGTELGLPGATLQEILTRLKKVYCGNIGFEYAHIENRERLLWLRDKIEKRNLDPDFGLPLEKKKRILEKLNGAVVFEKFLHTKYMGQKRFSLEGGETTIAALDAIINKASEGEVQEVVMGMAHRGRLNVLANIMGKTYEQIFNEFEGNTSPDQSFGDGDVKYHLGFSSQVKNSRDEIIELKLVPNPSHLESVNPVVEGFSRAKADILYGSDYDKILPLLIHGDAAVAGQGIAYETVQMSKLAGFKTGGTIHFVINNQIGFTTSWDDARSSTYCTAAASLVQAPVFHVNGDDPEAVVFAVELATEYRQRFNNDVFIDMVCFRRHGHNEGDDPKFTQPDLYDIIKSHPDAREIYIRTLTERGDIEGKLAEDMEKGFWGELQLRLDMVKEKSLPYSYQAPEKAWRKLKKQVSLEDILNSTKTGISEVQLNKIVDHLHSFPDGFTPQSKINRLIKHQRKLLEQGKLDWAMAELTAYSSILMDGKDIRMSGQDVKRGTFSHRHAIVRDSKNYNTVNRLDNLQLDQGRFMIYNSLLSEFAVLGFEYGYSMATPDALVIWEAQFGDFHNGAQTIIDQYIAAGESKWRRMNGLVMLLPHGYEGQGPEHSSAKPERFLSLAANLNLIICNPSTPANIFHLLRRQLAWPFRKPLIVMSPKSLLRHPLCVSNQEEFLSDQSFQEVIPDPLFQSGKPDRLLLCSGKVFYDLIEEREKRKDNNTAIIRIEQLYPFPERQVQEILFNFEGAKFIWVQEEPQNMGAWTYINSNVDLNFDHVISRRASASPATGLKKIHIDQQNDLLERAFTI